MVSTRLAHFELPPQWSTMRKAREILLRDGSRKIIHMEKGDYISPEFKPPVEAIAAVYDELQKGKVSYSPGPGIPELREALAREMSDRGRATVAEEIVVTPGAKFAIAASLLLFLDEGDEVIMPDPGYPPDEFWARYQRAVIKHVRFRDPRHIDTDHLDSLISPRTRMVIVNTPQRPNGQLVENIAEVAAVLLRHPQVIVISDEIFARVVYEPYRHESLAAYPELKERTVVIDTFSKGFVMTGFRIGWLAAPPHLAAKYDILLQNSCTNVSTFVQKAALAALGTGNGFSKELLQKLRRKRDLACEILSSSKRLTVEKAQGAFYLFPALSERRDDLVAVDRLLEGGVAVVPGSAFGKGGCGHIRLTFTLEDDVLAEGVQRLVEIVEKMYA